ncbi:hypothetical protein BBR01nite_43680 [Brevibacillus brevis]|nr:hypothetical protein BBR01nite_43680 [Brevibacillus brevis]
MYLHAYMNEGLMKVVFLPSDTRRKITVDQSEVAGIATFPVPILLHDALCKALAGCPWQQ